MSLLNKLFKSKESKADAPVEPIAVSLNFDQKGIKYELGANPEDIELIAC